MRRRLMLALLLGLAFGALGASPAGAQSRQRCFQETGFCISGSILAYWERNGGLAVFGLPIGPLRTETVEGWSGPVQWFERDRLEDHGRGGVLAGRLGAQALDFQGRPWHQFPRISSAPRPCRFFPETGHSLCGLFLTYWQQNGGLERFGYPLTEPIEETLANGDGTWTGTVQYFERRRMEWHRENAGTRYEILLGLLGKEILPAASDRCAEPAPGFAPLARAYPDLMGCPAPFPQISAPIATQQFERGSLVWVKPRSGGAYGSIFMVYYDSRRGALVWEQYGDTWREGDPVSGGETPPPGLLEPVRGFGKLWRELPQVRSTLGWATAPEEAGFGI
jgi:hypothetical protein